MQGIVVGRGFRVGGWWEMRWKWLVMTREGVRGERGRGGEREQVQMRLVCCPPMHHW